MSVCSCRQCDIIYYIYTYYIYEGPGGDWESLILQLFTTHALILTV